MILINYTDYSMEHGSVFVTLERENKNIDNVLRNLELGKENHIQKFIPGSFLMVS